MDGAPLAGGALAAERCNAECTTVQSAGIAVATLGCTGADPDFDAAAAGPDSNR